MSHTLQFFGSNSLTTTHREELRPFQSDRKNAMTSYFRNITTNKVHSIDLEITRRNNVEERRRKKNEQFLRSAAPAGTASPVAVLADAPASSKPPLPRLANACARP